MTLSNQNDLAAQGMLAVLVLYGRELKDAIPWPQLKAWLQNKDGPVLRHCLVYDNSPSAATVTALPFNAHLISNRDNGGTVAAYHAAAQHAAEKGCEWLLLLDQDTCLPPDYLERVQDAIVAAPNAVALVPFVVHGNQPVSPAIINASGSIVPCSNPERENSVTTAISSGVVIRRVAMASMTFPPEIWLDYVDHWMFLDISSRGERVARINSRLFHDLSVRKPSTLSAFRLRSILAAESVFYHRLGGRALAMLPFRRLLRAMRYVRIGRPSLAMAVVKTFFERQSAAIK